MSEANPIGSTVPGRYGSAANALTLQETPIAVAWNLQGDAADAGFADQARRLFGLSCLPSNNSVLSTDALRALWLGPGSWLLLAGATLPAGHPLTGFDARRDALNRAGGALFDVSASRVAWRLTGPRASAVLASGCPLDLHASAFAAGSCAQSVFGHVGALYCRSDGGDFSLLVARSLAREVWQTLCVASAPYGYDVLAPEPFS